MPQGFSWDQGSVLIGIELAEETNLALRSLHLSWRRQMQAGGSIFNSLLKTERLNELLEAEGAQGLCPKPLGDRGPNWGTSLLAILSTLSGAYTEGLQAASSTVLDPSKAGRIARGKCPPLYEGRGAYPLRWQLHHTLCCTQSHQTFPHSGIWEIPSSQARAWRNEPTLISALLWLLALKSNWGVSLLAQSSCMTPAGHWQQRWNCTQLLSVFLARSFWGGRKPEIRPLLLHFGTHIHDLFLQECWQPLVW